jgi:hypothetical protein
VSEDEIETLREESREELAGDLGGAPRTTTPRSS